MNSQIQLTTPSEWDNYFKYRGVKPDFYEHYSLPPYLIKALPADKNACICEIGCGFGQFLAAIRKLGYINTFGIEPSQSAYQHASSQGLKVCKGTVAEVAGSLSEKADFAYMCHVLEHIPKMGDNSHTKTHQRIHSCTQWEITVEKVKCAVLHGRLLAL